MLSVISLMGKKPNPQSKLQQKLIKEEEERYLDSTFSKRMVQNLTGLRRDSLQTFMQLYRPNIDTAKYMSDYDIILHIKKSYQEYIKPQVSQTSRAWRVLLFYKATELVIMDINVNFI